MLAVPLGLAAGWAEKVDGATDCLVDIPWRFGFGNAPFEGTEGLEPKAFDAPLGV